MKRKIIRIFWRKFDQTKNFPEAAGKQIRAYFDFNTKQDEKIKVKFALSNVSTEGAIKNLLTKRLIGILTKLKKPDKKSWNQELSKIAVTAETKDDLVKYCRTDVAYTGLKSVKTKEKADYMHSFLIAETFKYFYLLYAPQKTFDLKKVVFNTEAHPIRKTW